MLSGFFQSFFFCLAILIGVPAALVRTGGAWALMAWPPALPFDLSDAVAALPVDPSDDVAMDGAPGAAIAQAGSPVHSATGAAGAAIAAPRI
ncbi:hypothetical protein T484DRAFT_1858933 [Baffinella frigidus]|nr:hypothetical protein T484DRAFT_1858933 [Cryptophyta sp. CCMP2293]